MATKCYTERRAFLRVFTTMTAALALGACGGGDPSASEDAPAGGSQLEPPAPPGANLAPAWQPVPNIMFAQGFASSISIAAYVTDPNGDALTITKNSVALPPGVTYDAGNKRFVYDGVGAVASTSGNVLIASDGQP